MATTEDRVRTVEACIELLTGLLNKYNERIDDHDERMAKHDERITLLTNLQQKQDERITLGEERLEEQRTDNRYTRRLWMEMAKKYGLPEDEDPLKT